MCIVSKTDIKFETKIPVFGGRTNAALSTPLVLLSLIEQADNRDLMIKIQSSVRLMCVKYLNGYDYANLSNSTKLPFEIFDMSK